MPQKRNPDAAELVRGHAGRILGCMTSLMVTMKGLPLAYSKDMQDDKPPVFEAYDLLALSIAAMTGMIDEIAFVPDRLLGGAGGAGRRRHRAHRPVIEGGRGVLRALSRRRSEERRVGKECVGTGRSRWSPSN